MTESTVHLIDDNEAFRMSTAWMLEAAGFTVHNFASGEAYLESAVAAAELDGATCVLCDIRMPGMSGLQLQQELRRRGVRLPLVFITGHGDVALAVEAMRNGAVNFIEKPCSPEQLVRALEQGLSRSCAGASGADTRQSARLAKLTPRERQVFDLVVQGKLNKTIADVLSISIKTVEMHRANMMSKLEARNLPDLVRLSIAVQTEVQVP